jgi:hypothetical protein
MPSFNVYAQQNPSNLDVLNSQHFNYGTTPKQPVAEQNQTYFAYFDGVGGTGPEYIDGTGYFIKYIINTEGNIANPEPFTVADSPQAVPLYNLKDNFEVGKNATVKLIEPNPIYDNIPNAEILQGTHRIAHVGRIVPILVTETGENVQNYITTMSFGPLSSQTNNAIGNVGARMFYQNNSPGYTIIQESDWTDFPFNAHNNLGAGAWARTANVLTAQSSSVEAGTRIRFKVRLYVDSRNMVANISTFNVRILKNGVDVIWEQLINIYKNTNQYATYSPTPYIDFEAGDEFKLQYFINNGTPANPYYADYSFYILGLKASTGEVSDTSLTIEQEIPASQGGTTDVELINGVNAIYALPSTSPSASYLAILDNPTQKYSTLYFNSTASRFIYDNGLTQNLDSASSAFGFSPIGIPFGDTRPGDFVRFEYNKEQVYTITEIIKDFPFGGTPIPNTLAINVTPNIGSTQGVNTNIQAPGHFIIYRVINDGTYVVLDVKKDAPGGAYSGIIQPEFISNELVQKYDKIITDLTSKEIIQ